VRHDPGQGVAGRLSGQEPVAGPTVPAENRVPGNAEDRHDGSLQEHVPSERRVQVRVSRFARLTRVISEFRSRRWMAVSQFKPTYARRAFPCYDEPGYKTPFNVSLGRQGYQMALSNMPCYSSQRL